MTSRGPGSGNADPAPPDATQSDSVTRPGATRPPGSTGEASAPARIGRHRVLGRLGAGGMGVVYEALDERLGRRVALKTIAHEHVADPEARVRLEREARAMAALSHPGIVVIHSIEDDGDALYISMELVDGTTLASRIREGALPERRFMDWALQLADAVAAAHAAGIVHRDLKPSNVMVTPSGRLKVLDFGIARLHETLHAFADALETPEGIAVGTPSYMCPEEIVRGTHDARADVWAIGVILHEMATGRRPFDGATTADIVETILKSPAPSLSASRADLPPALEDLVTRCLEKDPARRPADAGEVRDALLAIAPGGAAGLGPTSRMRQALASERDAFVGRAAELTALSSLLEARHRLVSVVGLGGSGKTRLVLRHARTSLARWPGGAWFCDLSDARSADGIVSSVARALDLPLDGADPVAQIGDALAARGRCLVILDNFEQVARHAGSTLGRLMDLAPDATFLVTSREVLGLPGEQAFALPPLAQADAEALFLERAKAARHDFSPDAEEHAEIGRLVVLLDLLPLAIELAAARVALLSPAQIRDRLSDRFSLLSGAGWRHDRQATLRATLDWSWDLLADGEKAALAQLSVFEGGFTLEQAEAVIDLASWREAPPILDVVQALLDRSLVRRGAGERLDMLATVSEYAAEKLRTAGAFAASGPGAEASARQRHGACFAAAGDDEALESLGGHGGVARRRALARDLPNLVVACRRALRRGDAKVAAATASAAWAVIELSGPFALGLELAEAALQLRDLSPVERARMEHVAGRAEAARGRNDAARPHYQAALAIARETGNRSLEGVMLGLLGCVYWALGRPHEARAHGEEALSIHREVGHRAFEGVALTNLGILNMEQGSPREAQACFEEALAIHREVGNRLVEGNVLANLGIVHMQAGALDDAQSCFAAALAAHRDIGNRRNEGILLVNMGCLHQERGATDEARACFDTALAIVRDAGDRRSEGILLANLADVHLAEGRRAEARAAQEAALAIHRAVGNRRHEAIALTNLGSLLRDEGLLAEAREQYEASLPIHREVGDRRLEGIVLGNIGLVSAREGDVAAARAALDEGEALLRAVGIQPDLVGLLCSRAESEHVAGSRASALAALAEAERVAAELRIPEASDLRRSLARTRALVSGPQA